MNTFKNLKIKYKMLLLSGSMLLALIVVGFFSLGFMWNINNGTTVVSSNWLPSVIIAEELNTATSDFRIAEASHVISSNSTAMSRYESDLNSIEHDIESMLAEYKSTLITNATDTALINEASDLWAEYYVLHNKMIEYSKSNKTTEAMDIVENESEVLFTEISNVFLELVEFNKTGADNASLEGDGMYQSALFLMIVTIIVISVISIIFANFIINSVVNPISDIENAASQIVKGNLSVHVDYESKDALGNLSNSMRALCTMFEEMIADLSHMLQGMADGDFTVKSDKPNLYVGDFAPLLRLTSMISDKLSEAMYQINLASNEVSIGSDQVAGTSQMLSQGSLQQASSIEQLSETLSNISDKTKYNSENAALAKLESEKSKEEIQLSSSKMQEMIASMDNITNKSNEIGKIIKTIDDIAFQTNILALNAAVEAARAGETGKGFAVVAGEVRNLAEKSAESAKSTALLIDETLSAVKVGSKLAAETGEAIEMVVAVVEKVTTLVEQIASESNEQQSAVVKISDDVNDISNVIRSNSASTEESAATSEELNAQSKMLKSLVSKFRYTSHN